MNFKRAYNKLLKYGAKVIMEHHTIEGTAYEARLSLGNHLIELDDWGNETTLTVASPPGRKTDYNNVNQAIRKCLEQYWRIFHGQHIITLNRWFVGNPMKCRIDIDVGPGTVRIYTSKNVNPKLHALANAVLDKEAPEEALVDWLIIHWPWWWTKEGS